MSYNLTPEELHEMRDWYPKAEQLVRLGMLPVNQLPHIKRALVGIENDAYLPLIIRRPFYRFVDQVMELALGEPGIYRLIRNKVAANRNDSITNRYMPEETTMEHGEELNEEVLDERNKENKTKKNLHATRLGFKIKYENEDKPSEHGPVKVVGRKALRAGIKEETILEGNAENKAKKNAHATKLGHNIASNDGQASYGGETKATGRKELRTGSTKFIRSVREGIFDAIRAKDIKLADIGKNRKPIPKPVPGRVKMGTRDGQPKVWDLTASAKKKTNEEMEISEGNAENRVQKNKHAERQGGNPNPNFYGEYSDKGREAKVRGRQKMRDVPSDALGNTTLKQRQVERQDARKKGYSGTFFGPTTSFGKKDGVREELELLNLNLLDEDVDYRKTPEGMLQTLSNMVKIKKRHRGKVSVNDRKIASKARNELRRRKYYNAGQTLAASFDTAYLDLADLLAEEHVFLTDLQLDALENEMTEETLMEVSPELKMRYAKKVESNFKEKGLLARGTKKFDKLMKRLKTASAILKTESVEALDEISNAMKKRYIKKAEQEQGDAAQDYRKARAGSAAQDSAEDSMYKRDDKIAHARKTMKAESVEVVQELTKKTLVPYVKKAVNSKSDADFSLGMHSDKQNQNQHYRAVKDDGSYMASVNQLLRKSEKRNKGIQMATDKLAKESYAGEEDYPHGEDETYTTEKPKKNIRPSKSTWYKSVDDAADVKGVDPKMRVKFSKEAFDQKFNKTLELFEVKHISELDADMTKLFLSLVQSEGKSDEDYQERVYDKIRAAKKDDSNLSPEQIRYRNEKQARAAKTQAALNAAKEELPKTKIGTGWSKVKSDVE